MGDSDEEGGNILENVRVKVGGEVSVDFFKESGYVIKGFSREEFLDNGLDDGLGAARAGKVAGGVAGADIFESVATFHGNSTGVKVEVFVTAGELFFELKTT